MKKYIKSIIFLLILPFLFQIINIVNVFILWGKYGESASGSAKSIEVGEIFFVYHSSIIVPIIFLLFWTLRKKERLIENSILAFVSVCIYVAMERFDLIIR